MPDIPDELRPSVVQGVYETFNETQGPLTRLFDRRRYDPPGNLVAYDRRDWGHGMARNTAYGAPAPKGSMPGGVKVTYEGITMKEAIPLDVNVMRRLGSMEPATRQEVVADAVRNVRLKNERRVHWLAAQFLTGGALLSSTGLGGNGSAAGVVYLDYAAQHPQSPIPVTLGLASDHVDAAVAASWATSTTDIYADLKTARRIVSRDSGINADLLIMNETTMGYIEGNQRIRESREATNQLASEGRLTKVWGFNFLVVNEQWAYDLETMSNSSAGYEFHVPDNVVIVTGSNNGQCGRIIREMQPSDQRANPEHRGPFAWTDQDPKHPATLEPGLEETIGIELGVPNSVYLFQDVTST